MNNLKIHASREIWNNCISIHVAENKQNSLFIANEVTFTEQSEGMMTRPCLRLSTGEAQALMDELWGCGLRPSEGTGSAGSLAATQNHLKDMQGIAKALLHKFGAPIEK